MSGQEVVGLFGLDKNGDPVLVKATNNGRLIVAATEYSHPSEADTDFVHVDTAKLFQTASVAIHTPPAGHRTHITDMLIVVEGGNGRTEWSISDGPDPTNANPFIGGSLPAAGLGNRPAHDSMTPAFKEHALFDTSVYLNIFAGAGASIISVSISGYDAPHP